MTRLPLFPLGSVLFPGLVMPLHIFEERYRALVRDLVALPEGTPRRFGVVAIREGLEVGTAGVRALHEVGCTAEIRQVETYDDGRFDIVATGVTRFRIGELHVPAGTPQTAEYLAADVDLLDEPDGVAPADAAELAGVVGTSFLGYRARLLGGDDDTELPDDPGVLSYLVAAAMVLELPAKQDLLAAPDTATRLRAERRLLHRETELLRLLPSLPAVDLGRAEVSLS